MLLPRLSVGARLFAVSACGLFALAIARPVDAQFGALKRLKNKVTGAPDSAAVADSAKKDSLRVAAGLPLDTMPKAGQSMFSRAKNAASKASDAFEAKTGISAKDAALAATGVGIAGVVAKKAGLPDVQSIGANVASKAISAAAGSGTPAPSAGIMSKLGIPGMPGVAGTPGTPAAPGAAMSAMSAMSSMGAQLPSMSGARSVDMTGANAETVMLMEFQQEMTDVAIKASTGDANARARLDLWQALLVKHQAEMMRLSTQEAAMLPDTPQKLMDLQMALISEWRGKKAPATPKTTKTKAPKP